MAFVDTDDSHLAPGTGFPKFVLGPSNGPIKGGSTGGGGQIGGVNDVATCGLSALGQSPCTFAGGADIEGSGGVAGFNPATGDPMSTDWMIQINASPGDYAYVCFIHPGMFGNLHVVGATGTRSTQADIDAFSAQQFQEDQALGLEAEKQYNIDKTTNDSGVITHHVSVGVAAANNHVGIDEMLPQRVSMNPGEQVEFKWRDGHNVHSVGFAQAEPQLPGPFVFDCGTRFLNPPAPGVTGGGVCVETGQMFPEVIADPGNALSGVVLKNPQVIVDSGVLAGADYGVQPTVQTWSIRTNGNTQSGAYQYFCNVHDFMVGRLLIAQ